MTVSEAPKSRRLPGVEGLWVFIGADSVIFALLFSSFMNDRSANPALFEDSRHALNFHLGGLNTLILLTSSWLVALAVQGVKHDESGRVPRFLLGGILTGMMFVISKSVEYAGKFITGINPATNEFFMWYFALTGIHLLHVLAGISLLVYVWRKTLRSTFDGDTKKTLESVASFWHLVDLLWIILFPLLYLLR